MSLLRFDRDANQFRVFLPTVKNLPPNPHFALQHPSETADTESELTPYPPEDQYGLLACDQRSFVTGSASADLQASHIINSIIQINSESRSW